VDLGRSLDSLVGIFSPRAQFSRMRARAAVETVLRHYEGASQSRRTAGWRAPSTSANTSMQGSLAKLRDRSRDLCRNNPWADHVVELYESEIVGPGIVPRFTAQSANVAAAMQEAWKEHCETRSIDAEERLDVYGLQALAVRTIIESGEVLWRRRRRLPSDGLPLQFQVETLEPDHLDPVRDFWLLANGGRIRYAIQLDPLGRREGYWLLPNHPGEGNVPYLPSKLVPASEVLHAYRLKRPKQLRGVPALASVLIKLRDGDEYEDAQLLKQKISACLTAFVTDLADGEEMPAPDPNGDKPSQPLDALEPGAIVNLPSGKTVEFSTPPSVDGYEAYVRSILRGVAAGAHVTYEALSGDWSNVNYSSARMGFLQNSRTVDRFREHVLITQLLNPLVQWVAEAAVLAGRIPMDEPVAVTWTPPRRAMLDPKTEVPARRDAVRAGQCSLSEILREDGLDPEQVFSELASDFKKLDALGLKVESDPRVPLRTGTPAGGEGTQSEAAPTGG
jgi:lambda family phage portal protein